MTGCASMFEIWCRLKTDACKPYLIVTAGVPNGGSLTPEVITPAPDAFPGLVGGATVTCPAAFAPAGPLRPVIGRG